MKMKEATERSSDQLRAIATLVMVLGVIIAAFIIVIGFVFGGIAGSTSGSNMVVNMVGGTMGSVIIAILVLLAHYIRYVEISAIATLVENSDRSDVVTALEQINKTLQSRNEEQKVGKDFTDSDNEKPMDVTLEKIDISDYS
jgi:uncharacterized membrane protein